MCLYAVTQGATDITLLQPDPEMSLLVTPMGQRKLLETRPLVLE